MIIQVASVDDIGRLACAFEHKPQPIFAFRDKSKWNLLIQFQFNEKKMDHFVTESDSIDSFLGYRNVYGDEIVAFFKVVKDTSYIYAPIIFLKNIPFKLYQERKSSSKKLSIEELLDLGSLVRIATYRIYDEESPLPLFVAQHGSGAVLFTMLSYLEEGRGRIYYIFLDKCPTQSFIKYSSSDGSINYTSNVDETGFIYVKIIKLRHLPFNVGV
ncbi:MAG: hypothetical protein QXJ17_01875 [Nitrososphaeria archaeon]